MNYVFWIIIIIFKTGDLILHCQNKLLLKKRCYESILHHDGDPYFVVLEFYLPCNCNLYQILYFYKSKN